MNKVKIKKKLTSNMEDYLEAIGSLSQSKKAVRVKDLAKILNVRTSSVNSALATLSKAGLVIHERYGYIELTKKGVNFAQDIQNRHNTLTRFLTEVLNIKPEVAVREACKIEHSISPTTFKKLKEFVEFASKHLGKRKKLKSS